MSRLYLGRLLLRTQGSGRHDRTVQLLFDLAVSNRSDCALSTDLLAELLDPGDIMSNQTDVHSLVQHRVYKISDI
jgi:hypothetical protein